MSDEAILRIATTDALASEPKPNNSSLGIQPIFEHL